MLLSAEFMCTCGLTGTNSGRCRLVGALPAPVILMKLVYGDIQPASDTCMRVEYQISRFSIALSWISIKS